MALEGNVPRKSGSASRDTPPPGPGTSFSPWFWGCGLVNEAKELLDPFLGGIRPPRARFQALPGQRREGANLLPPIEQRIPGPIRQPDENGRPVT